VTNHQRPVALGMRAPGWTALAIWRLEGSGTVELPLNTPNARVLYPDNLGIVVQAKEGRLTVHFPRPKMACIVVV
jgi:hypothetical protein